MTCTECTAMMAELAFYQGSTYYTQQWLTICNRNKTAATFELMEPQEASGSTAC